MTRGDDLASLFRGYLRQQSVSLALAQDLEMRIRLVEERDRAAIGVHVRQKQQRLLQSPSAGRDIERDPVFPVGHLDFAPFLHIAGLVESGAEEGFRPIGQKFPSVSAFLQHAVAQVAQHLRRSALADPDVDRAAVQPGFRRRKARHRREESDPGRTGGFRNRHAFSVFAVSQRPAVKRFLVRVVELQSAGPGGAGGDPLDNHVDPDIGRPLPASVRAHIARVQPAPEKGGARNGNRQDILTVDGDAGSLLRHGLSGALLVPAFQARVPEGQRLHGGSLAGIVRTDEDHRIPEFNVDALEALEISDDQPGQHLYFPLSRCLAAARADGISEAMPKRTGRPTQASFGAPRESKDTCSARQPLRKERGGAGKTRWLWKLPRRPGRSVRKHPSPPGDQAAPAEGGLFIAALLPAILPEVNPQPR